MKKLLLALTFALCLISASAQEGSYPDFTYAAEHGVEAVVYVRVTAIDQNSRRVPDIFDIFGLGGGSMYPRERVGAGSGVIITSDGYIVTNNHVVSGATKIEVTLNDERTYDATLVGADPATDVALIKIDGRDLPYLEFGNSDDLRLGEWVLAIGSPLELRGTITAGIVSAKGRSMPSYNGEFKIESFIQTDAAVNPGNSGGALVNRKGQLVGINTAIISPTGSYSGYSFAIPSNMAKKIVGDFKDFGTVKRAVLGVTVRNVDSKLARDLGLSKVSGVYIDQVVSGSAADKAGIKSGDVLTMIDRVVIANYAKMQEVLASHRPGDNVTVTVVRAGTPINLRAQLQGTEVSNATTSGSVSFYGATIEEASPELMQKYHIDHGVVITSVSQGKLQSAGAQKGQIIMYVNNESVAKPEDILKIAQSARRSLIFEGVSPNGRTFFYGFGL